MIAHRASRDETQSTCCGGGRCRWLRSGSHRRRARRIGSRARGRPGSSAMDGSRCETRARSRSRVSASLLMATAGCARGCGSAARRSSKDGSIYDLRFAERIGQNFSRHASWCRARGCPANVPSWGMPRADLLASSWPEGQHYDCQYRELRDLSGLPCECRPSGRRLTSRSLPCRRSAGTLRGSACSSDSSAGSGCRSRSAASRD